MECKQFFAWYGSPNRNDDYITTTEISEEEYVQIDTEYPDDIVANLETANLFRQKYQCYLMKFPREYVISELRSFHPYYEKEYFNIKEIVRIQMEA